MDPRIDSPMGHSVGNTKLGNGGFVDKVELAKNEARSLVGRAGDTVKDTVKTGFETVKHGVDDAIHVARDLPDHVGQYGRALDRHVHANPRLHVGIMAGAGVLLGAFFGGKVVKWAILAAAAYGVTRLIPRDFTQRLLAEAKS